MFQRLTELYGPYEIVRETKGKTKEKTETKGKTKTETKTKEKTDELKQLKTETKQQSIPIITVDYIDNTEEKSKKLLNRFTVTQSNPTIAFTTSFAPNEYIDDGDVKIYNRVTNLPKHINNKVVNNVIDIVLKNPVEEKTIRKSRDDYLLSGKLYDFSSEISENPPFDLRSLQNLFIQYGGLPTGYAYPSDVSIYNSMGTLGVVKQYFNDLVQNIKSNNYNLKRESMLQLFGKLELKRAPYIQGVEVFWFFGQFLGRTIEKDFIRGTKESILQISDIRPPSDFSIKFQVNANNGFYILLNQSDISALNDRIVDKPGLFANMDGNIDGNRDGIKDVNQRQTSQYYSTFKATHPNVLKIFGNIDFNLPNCSLACESRAPFLNFEINDTLREIRNPGIFSKFIEPRGLTYHTRTEEKMLGKCFARLNSANSSIHIYNISNQCWGSISFAIRLQTMPVKETLIHIGCNIILKPINGSNAGIYIDNKWTELQMSLNKWYLIYFIRDKGLTINCVTIDNPVIKTPVEIPNINSNSIIIGTKNFNLESTSSFVYDIAWIHFFDYIVTVDDIYRDCMANWIYT